MCEQILSRFKPYNSVNNRIWRRHIISVNLIFIFEYVIFHESKIRTPFYLLVARRVDWTWPMLKKLLSRSRIDKSRVRAEVMYRKVTLTVLPLT